MKQKSSEIYPVAQRIVAECLSSDDNSYADIALQEGVLDTFAQLLCASQTQLLKETLWTLSNLTAGTVEQAYAFISHENLVAQVLTFC